MSTSTTPTCTISCGNAVLLILQAVLITLKLVGVITWSWFFVFLPIWGYLALVFFCAFLLALVEGR